MLLAAVVAGGAIPSPAAASPRAEPIPVLVVTDVGDAAQSTMPRELWRKLAVESLHARNATAESGTVLPDAAQCRSAGAAYAVLATFNRAMRLPGLAQDPDRAYAVARITVRDCATGDVWTKTVRIESDPISQAARIDPEASAEQIWDRVVRAAFAREPVVLAPPAATAAAVPSTAAVAHVTVARIVRIENGLVLLAGGRLAIGQQLRDIADSSGRPHEPIGLIVLSVDGKLAQASVTGPGTPNEGDAVEAAPAPAPPAPAAPTASPAPRP